MSQRQASDLRKGDRFAIKGERGERIATVQWVEHMAERDLLPHELQKWGSIEPIVMIYVSLNHPIPVPCMPAWRTSLWNLARSPDDMITLL